MAPKPDKGPEITTIAQLKKHLEKMIYQVDGRVSKIKKEMLP